MVECTAGWPRDNLHELSAFLPDMKDIKSGSRRSCSIENGEVNVLHLEENDDVVATASIYDVIYSELIDDVSIYDTTRPIQHRSMLYRSIDRYSIDRFCIDRCLYHIDRYSIDRKSVV